MDGLIQRIKYAEVDLKKTLDRLTKEEAELKVVEETLAEKTPLLDT